MVHEETLPALVATVEGAVVRREFVERFPYAVVFVGTNTERRVILIRRGSSDPARGGEDASRMI
jgi:hypothetical protein